MVACLLLIAKAVDDGISMWLQNTAIGIGQ